MLGVLFVMSIAATAFGEVNLGGEIRIRGWYEKNILPGTATGVSGTPADHKNLAFYDQRVRINVDAKVADNLKGFIQLEADAGKQDDKYMWARGAAAPAGASHAGENTKPGANMGISQAYIQYTGSGLLGIPAGMKIGHMPLSLGEKIFFDNTQFGDDAIVFFIDPNKQTHIGALTFKIAENKIGNNPSADIDGYVLVGTYKWDDKNTVGANYTYLASGSSTVAMPSMKFQNLGIHANGEISGFGYKAEADFQFGDVQKDVKARGYGFLLGVNYKLNPVNIKAGFALGSGDKADTADKYEGFATFVGTVIHPTIAYEYRVKSAAGDIGTGLNNTTYYTLGVDYAATSDISLSADAYILRATKTAAGVSKNVGVEVDIVGKYQIAKNLAYSLNMAYFDAGKFYEESGMVADAKVATVLMHSLTLSF